MSSCDPLPVLDGKPFEAASGDCVERDQSGHGSSDWPPGLLF